MKINSIDTEFIRKCIPNVMFEVEGETPLAQKLDPWIRSAKLWLETEYIGPNDFLNEEDNNRATYIVVLKAFADAVPSLDLVVTPTGFGVINTDTIAPASKERIERLVESLRSRIDENLDLLLEYCHQYAEWRTSERGKYFCATFLSYIRDVRKPKYNSYDELRSEAMHVEYLMEEKFLGHNLMTRLRDEYNSRKPYEFIYLADAMHSAVMEVVYRNGIHIDKALWHSCRPIIELLRRFPEYYEIWQAEMGDRFKPELFKNDIKGSYYF